MENCKEIEILLSNSELKEEIEIIDFLGVEEKSYKLTNEIFFYENLQMLYYKSNEENYFWQYCNLSTYKKTFDERFEIYKKTYTDAELNDFISKELTLLNSYLKHDFDGNVICLYYTSTINPDIKFPIYNDCLDEFRDVLILSNQKKISFLEKEITKQIKVINSSNIKFTGTQTDFIELVKALIENESLKGNSQKEIIETLSNFLNIKINNPDKLIQDLKKRNNGSETLFLDSLKETLYDYINST
ncbi:hypothetical protein FRY74_01345 [Vicingus serpentipes]|uniref:RteC protein n=1 Tax=Vicingus serpentipes TaxID=1926625 RepID=A0A5C6RWW9_9FLAO|nr:RteC domain-containing protein [Vicingus serpentipes]TXB66858.1 hypothetical protein FRY74_01345 [Vicingus serpentipes]